MTRPEMLAIVTRLDAKARDLLLTGADDARLFVGMIDDMPDFKRLLDSPYKNEIDGSAQRFPGFYRYAVALTNLARGIASGAIEVPR